MLRLDLVRLGREGSARVDVQIPADDPIWEGLGASFAGPVGVRLSATFAGGGAVVVRGPTARSVGRFASRVRRQRLTANRCAVVRTHASGCSARSSLRRCDQARTNASWTHSSASSRLPIMA